MAGTEEQRAWVTRVLRRDPAQLAATANSHRAAQPAAAPSPAAENRYVAYKPREPVAQAPARPPPAPSSSAAAATAIAPKPAVGAINNRNSRGAHDEVRSQTDAYDNPYAIVHDARNASRSQAEATGNPYVKVPSPAAVRPANPSPMTASAHGAQDASRSQSAAQGNPAAKVPAAAGQLAAPPPVPPPPAGYPANRRPPSRWGRDIDTSRCQIGTPIKAGTFGSINWVSSPPNATPLPPNTPPLVIKLPNSNDQVARQSLQHEAEMYEKVGLHKNFLKCAGMRTVGGKEGLVMEGIVGEDMDGVMRRLERLRKGDDKEMKKVGMKRALSQEKFVGTLQYIMAQTLEGLQHLAFRKVVHNDIRPANIMCDAATGQVKIVDFGSSSAVGPLPDDVQLPFQHASVAPEIPAMMLAKINDPQSQAASAPVTPKSDVFSAGEAVRRTMERQQFSYNRSKETGAITVNQAADFAAPGRDGKPKTSLTPLPALTAQGETRAAAPAGKLTWGGMQTRVYALLHDPFITGTPPAVALQNALTETKKKLAGLDGLRLSDGPSDNFFVERYPDQAKVQAILGWLEVRVHLAEERLKRAGTVRDTGRPGDGNATETPTAYADFVNATMHPDKAQRLTAFEALNHPFLKDRLLDDAAAQEVLKMVLAKRPAAQPVQAAAPAPSAQSERAPAPLKAAAVGLPPPIEEVVEDDAPAARLVKAAELPQPPKSEGAPTPARSEAVDLPPPTEEVLEDDAPENPIRTDAKALYSSSYIRVED